MAEADRAAASPAGQAAATYAPQAFAHAEKMHQSANEAYRNGDLAGAQILAERALAAYQHALVLARVAKAEQAGHQATAALEDAQKKVSESKTELERLQAEANDLEARVKVLRESVPLTASPPTHDRAREEARLSAARSLALDAKLLCAAAQLLDPKLQGLGPALDAASDLDKRLTAGAVHPAPIDDAMRARARCLSLVTGVRRRAAAHSTQGNADALLAEISAMGDFAPVRDERGVVVTMRKLFSGVDIVAAGRERLKALARVATAHPTFPLQVVVHERPRKAKAEAGLESRPREEAMGQAVARALSAEGVPEAKIRVEPAGAEHPLSVGASGSASERDDRVELVFVDPGG